MPLKTTVIGSYPCPKYLKVPSWFDNKDHTSVLRSHGDFLKENNASPDDFRKLSDRALKEVVDEQCELGLDVITDGELERESYVWFLCRQLSGITFENLEVCTYRDGACVSTLPIIEGPIGVGSSSDVTVKQWLRAQELSSKPVKVTVPGPFTVIGSTNNKFYKDNEMLAKDLAAIINQIFKAVVEAGCQHVQLDEPVFMRDVEAAMAYGIDCASKCIEGLGSGVTKTIHVCCGYPTYLDQTDYKKADRKGYFQLSDKLDQAGFDEISLEDAHQRNDLTLLSRFKSSKVILGSVTIAQSRVESVSEIRERLESALKFISSDRLVVAPDCGLAYLPHDIMRQKVTNMVKAARSLP